MFATSTKKPNIHPGLARLKTYYFSFKSVKGLGMVVTNINPSSLVTQLTQGQVVVQHRETIGQMVSGYGLVKASNVSLARVYVECSFTLP